MQTAVGVVLFPVVPVRLGLADRVVEVLAVKASMESQVQPTRVAEVAEVILRRITAGKAVRVS